MERQGREHKRNHNHHDTAQEQEIANLRTNPYLSGGKWSDLHINYHVEIV